jgi:hypothetical protein
MWSELNSLLKTSLREGEILRDDGFDLWNGGSTV